MQSSIEERQFVIFNLSEISKINFEEVLESSADTLRKSLDGTLTFVKWEGPEPGCIRDLTSAQGPYTYQEIMDILDSPDWLSQEPI